MVDFSALISRIEAAVYENGVQAITGQILQDCLKDVVNTVNVQKQDGIYRVTVTVDNNTGVPSATARMDDDTYTLEFSFHNLKGEKGDKGDKGDTPVLTADSDGVIYSDGVMLTRVIKDTTDALTTRSESDHARAESDHARAETDHTDITRARGDAETAASEANYASLRANTAADNADAAREAIQSDLAQKQDVIPDLQQIRAGATDTVKYSTQSLTDAQKEQARTNIGAADESEVSQLRSEVDGVDMTVTDADVTSAAGRWTDNNGVIGTGTSGVLHRAEVIDLTGIVSFSLTTYMSWAITDAAFLCDDSGNIIETIPRLPNPGDPTVITDKAVPEGVTKIYINFATTFELNKKSLGIEEKFDNKLQSFEVDVEEQIVTEVARGTGEAINQYQEQYGAREIADNTTPMDLSEDDFESGNLNGQTGAEIPATNVIRSGFFDCVGGANFTFKTSNSYRADIFCFDANKALLQGYGWQTGTYTGQLHIDTVYARIVIASPSGVTTAPVWDDATFTVTFAKTYKPTRAAAESEIAKVMNNYFDIELPILSPSPQLPADGETGSDFDAETMTSTEIQAAIESQIDKLTIPNVGVYPNTPKYGTIYETIGKDASGLYDIKAYIFTRRNRFAWRASAALYTWKSGGTTYYTDHRSPLVGDTVYSNNTRTDSGYTVTAYNSAGPSITVNGNTYTRDDAAKVDATDIFTQSALGATTTSIVAYNKSGVSVGTATVSSPTQIVLGGKTYARLSSGDFHTENKATIVIWGNEHGPQSDPNEPSIIIYRLIKDLCGCVGGEFLKFLRKYCKFVFIPAANPYGINKFVSDAREGRTNANDVNINRNYDTVGWGVQTDINKGSYAGDQPETQFIMNTALDVGADIAIDIHCLGYASSVLNEGRTHYEGYVSAINGKVEEIMRGFCGHSYTSYGSESPTSRATGADWIYSLGIAGGLIEMNAGPYAVAFDGKQHNAGIMFTDYTLLLNVIRMWYYNFDPTLDLSRMSIK
jgi:hypothetical protein